MGTLTFVDETTSGARGGVRELTVDEERLPLREVLRRRVLQEVAEYNDAADREVFRGLVRPAGAEQARGGYRLPERRRIDPDAQYRLALTAFGRGGFLVLVGDRQVEELDAVIDLRVGTEVVFLKLVPLVGG